MANREMRERFVRMKQHLEQDEPRFGHQREALDQQRLVTFTNGNKRPMGEQPSLTAFIFEWVGRPTVVISHLADRALSVASSSNHPRLLAPYRPLANRRPQRGSFHEAIREEWWRNSWAGPEGGRSWQKSNPAPRWRKDEWIELPCQPLRDRHPKVELLVRLPSPKPEPRIEHRSTNPRPVVLVQGCGLGEEAGVRMSTSPLTKRVLAAEFPIG